MRDMEPIPQTATELPPVPPSEVVVPEGVRRARAAFLRDFPTLLADRRTRGRYVCYHNDTLVAVTKDYWSMIDEAVARNLPEDASLIFEVTTGRDLLEQAIADEAELP
jgi:hypothetical protein